MKASATPVFLLSLIFCFGCIQKKDNTGTAIKEVKKSDPLEKVYDYDGEPLKVAVIGLIHTHVHWILGREDFGDVEIVGIVEPNRDLALRYSKQHGYTMDLVYGSMEKLYESVKPEAVLAFINKSLI